MIRKLPYIIIGLVLIAVVISNICFEVTPKTKVLLTQFGKIVGHGYSPGLHFKIPFIQDVSVYDGRILTLDNQTQTFTTAGNQNLDVAYFVKWKVSNAETYYQTTTGQQLVAMDRLSALINSGLRNEFAAAKEPAAVNFTGPALLAGLGKNTRKQVHDLGIELLDLRIRSITVAQAEVDAIYARMRAEQGRIASNFREIGEQKARNIRSNADGKAAKLLAQAENQAQEIRAQGDARAAEIEAAEYARDPEFFRFYQSLTAYKEALSGGKDVLVMSPNSQFFRYLSNADGKR